MLKKILFLICLILMFTAIVIASERPRWVSQPVYVYVPEYGKYSSLMKKAFLAWENKSGQLIRFKFVSKPSSANITVSFVEHVDNCNNELSVGCAHMTIRGGNYYKANLEIAMKIKGRNNAYRPINNIYGVMLHEVGHAIGLEHSKNSQSIMYPYDLPTMQYLTKTDIQLLYKKYR